VAAHLLDGEVQGPRFNRIRPELTWWDPLATTTGQVCTTTLPASCLPTRVAKVRTENGPQGSPKVTKATVKLNGQTVISFTSNANPAIREATVTLPADSTVAVTTLTGPSGSKLALSILSEIACVDVRITTPTANVEVPPGPLVVKGTVPAIAGVGVTVNGVAAAISGAAYGVIVPMDPTMTELVAVAVAPDGTRGEFHRSLLVSDVEQPVILRATPKSGPAPLDVEFNLTSSVTIASVALDHTGSGTATFQGPSLDGQTFGYPTPGLYYPVVTVTDDVGQQYVATTLVQVQDFPTLDGELQAKWAALRTALAQGNVSAASVLFSNRARAVYADQFNALAGVGALAQLATDLGNLTFVRNREGAVEYELRAIQNGMEYSFMVLFILDDDGIWRLDSF